MKAAQFLVTEETLPLQVDTLVVQQELPPKLVSSFKELEKTGHCVA